MAITFKVDDVVPAAEKCVTKPLSEVLPPGAVCLGRDAMLPVIQAPWHALITAVHLAFAQHRPLLITPDVVWITIAQGFAEHVRQNAEQLRARLVSHQRKRTIVVEGSSPPALDDGERWAAIIGAFRKGIEEEMGQGFARLLTCDFSTTTDVDRVVSEIVLMDAVSPYFDFGFHTICGIPEITLGGTTADWKTIRERLDVLAEFELGWWTQSLVFIIDQFVDTSEGLVRPEFWKAIYKPKETYDGKLVTGWVGWFFPYLKNTAGVPRKNEMLGSRKRQPKFDIGVPLHHIPAELSRVPVLFTPQQYKRDFVGGLVAVHQDENGVLSPISGFMVTEHTPR